MSALVKATGPVAVQAVAQEPMQYLTFMLGGEVFAIGILHIKEIIEYGQLTTVPMMPNFIRGVINLRGAVVPVIDLSVRFGRAPVVVTRRTCIVIIEINNGDERQDIGIVVDSVSEVLEIPASQVEPAPAFGAKIRTDFIQGMGKVNERFVIILNVLNVLSVDEMSQLTMAAQVGGTPEAMADGGAAGQRAG
jgi:purine-binding chemotaxis protein CheW